MDNEKLDQFDSLTGIEKMRTMVGALNNCNESFLQGFTIQQLIKIYRMWLSSDWTFMPDTWTERQVREALRGHEPYWNDNEQPVYPKYIRIKKLEPGDMLGLPVVLDK